MSWEWNDAEWSDAMLDALGEVETISKEAARDLAKTAVGYMRDTAPIGPGDDDRPPGTTRRSVRYRTNRDAEGEYVDFGPTSPIARFTEYGTSQMQARPWVRPAIEKAISEVFG